MDKTLSNCLFTYWYEMKTPLTPARTTACLRHFSDLGQIVRPSLPKGRPSIRLRRALTVSTSGKVLATIGLITPNPGFDVFDRVPIKRLVQGSGAITEMRRCENIREMAERMLGRQRFDIEHVQAGAGDFPSLQDFDESTLVDDGASCRIDQIGCRLHRCKLVSSNDATASMAENEMDGDDVRFS